MATKPSGQRNRSSLKMSKPKISLVRKTRVTVRGGVKTRKV